MAALRIKKKSRGVSIVETVLVLPLLLALTLGLIEYGNMLLRLQQMENVARQVARYSATPDATKGAADAMVTSMMTANGIAADKYTATVPDTSALAKGATFTVTIQITYSKIALTGSAITGSKPLVPVPAVIARKVTMAKEAP